MNQQYHRRTHRYTLGAVALACAAAAHGQDATKAGGIQEIVVTAQKRAQSASTTPLALSVIGGDDLRDAGASNAKALTDMTPNVTIGGGNRSSTEVTIRGIASNNNTEVGDPAAAFHIDGQYIARSQGAGASFFDLERVEVLRGPQGTLYGRNSTAGAINVITRKPESRFEASAHAEIGNYALRRFEGMVNQPLSSNFALRGVLSATKRDGYVDSAHAPQNAFSRDRSDADNFSGRVHGLLKLPNQASLLLTLDGSRDHGVGQGSVPYTRLAANPKGPEGRRQNPAIEGSTDNSNHGVTAELKVPTALGEVTALASRRYSKRDEHLSFGDAAFQTIDRANFRQDQVEVRLGSTGTGALQWVAGVFYFDELGTGIDFKIPLAPGCTGPSPTCGGDNHFVQDRLSSRSQAAFGQASYALMPGLRLTAGVRYSSDDKSRQGKTLLASTGALNYVNDASVSYGKATGKLGVDVDIAKGAIAYASLSTGYKAGGMYDGRSVVVNGQTLSPTYKPETLTATELGVKGRFLNNTLQFGAALFRYAFKDMQLSAIGFNAVATAATGIRTEGNVTQNAGRAVSQGLEFEGRWAASADDQIDFALGLLDAKYTSYVVSSTVDWTGKRLDKAPRQTLSLGWSHNWNLAGGALLRAHVGTKYSAKYVLSNFGVAQFDQSSFHRSDASLTYRSADDRWYVQGYVKNIEDRNVMVAFAGVQNTAFLAEPRSFGLRAGLTF